MEVMVGDKRFDDHYRKIRLGLRMMTHGARVGIASAWSTLTPDQLVKLRETWMPWADDGGFRGPHPKQYRRFFRSALHASHAAIFVGIHRMVGFDTSRPSIEGGERLCEAYEIYREWEPGAALEFDYAVLLAMGAVEGEFIVLSTCSVCRGALLIDKQGKPQTACLRCRKRAKKGRKRAKGRRLVN